MNEYQRKFCNAMKQHPCVESVRNKYGSRGEIAIVKLKPVEVTARDSGRSICHFKGAIEVGLGVSGYIRIGKWVLDPQQRHPHRIGGGMCLNLNFDELINKEKYDAAIYDLVSALSSTDERHANREGW